MGVTRTNGIPGLPGNNNFKVFYTGAKRLGYQKVHTGRMAINSQPRADRAVLPADRLLLPGLQVLGQMVDALHRDPGRDGDRQARAAARMRRCCRSSTTRPARSPACSTPTRTASSRSRRRASSASPATRSRARGCCSNSASAKFPDGLANSSGQVGKNYMRHMTGSVYAAFEKPVHMFRGTTMAGDHPGRGRPRPAARLRRRLRAGDPLAGPAVHGGVPRSRRLGPRASPARWSSYPNMAGMWIVGEDMPQESNRVTLHAIGEGPVRAADPQRPLRRPPERRRDAQPRLPPGHARSTRRPAPPTSTRPRPTPAPTIWAPTG